MTKTKNIYPLLLFYVITKNLFANFIERELAINQESVNWHIVKHKLKNFPTWWKSNVTRNKSINHPHNLQNFISSINIKQQDFFCRVTIKNSMVTIDALQPTPQWLERKFIYVYQTILEMLLKKKLITVDATFICYISDLPYNNETDIPIFAVHTYKSSQNVILLPDPQTFIMLFRDQEKLLRALKNPQFEWKNKKNILFWRGGPHDCFSKTGWQSWPFCKNSPRTKLIEISAINKDIDAGFTYYWDNAQEDLKERFGLANTVEPIDQFAYKYHISLDGSATASSGIIWKLLSNSVVIKQNSHYIKWYSNLLTPYKHYIPVNKDLSDLDVIMRWIKEHDEEAKEIADTATNLVKENLMLEDYLAYLTFIINQYGKLQQRSTAS